MQRAKLSLQNAFIIVICDYIHDPGIRHWFNYHRISIEKKRKKNCNIFASFKYEKYFTFFVKFVKRMEFSLITRSSYHHHKGFGGLKFPIFESNSLQRFSLELN